jgi:hypothetical protein
MTMNAFFATARGTPGRSTSEFSAALKLSVALVADHALRPGVPRAEESRCNRPH